MATVDLAEYRGKRDFRKTPEPDGSTRFPAKGPLRFVVQKHQATALHFDLRLEAGGVLKSFAVPKGPSADPSVKRGAQQTEDHPLDYLDFEGSIPRGQYGAGHMIVWDTGTYSPDEKGEYDWLDPERASLRIEEEIAAGKVSFTIRGTRMHGSWTLIRTKNGWLLIKHKDQAASNVDLPDAFETSIRSGLTIADLAAGTVAAGPFLASPADAPGARESQLPAPFAPMLAAAGQMRSLSESTWSFEPKIDGIRCLAFVNDGQVKLYTRNLNDVTDRYPNIVRALAVQPLHDGVLDGEIAALDERGRPRFELLQQRMNLGDHRQVAQAEGTFPVVYFAFDLLHLDGFDLRGAALEDRRVLLRQVLLPSASLSPVEVIESDPQTAFQAAVALGFEGLVAKRRGSPYRSGRRSDSWLKLKHRESDEFLVGGFTVGEGGRESTFGGLLLGTPRDDGMLEFRGRVGSGFDDRRLGMLRSELESLVSDVSPFAGEIPDAAKTVFVRPELVVEVEYAEVTSAGILRAPVFHGLRADKAPSDLSVAGDLPVVAPLPDDLATDIEAVLSQLETKKQKLEVIVGEHSLGVTNLDKELWPAFGGHPARTKRDYLRYLATVAPILLPHLRDRPLTLTRYPDGIGGDSFYQRHWQEKDMPPFVDYITMFTDSNGGDRPFLLCNNLPTLLWLGQLADIELHASLARVSTEPDAAEASTEFAGDREAVEGSVLNLPDHLLFDLDPYIYAGTEKKGDEPQFNRTAFDATCDVALVVREVLAGLGLSAFVKTSGATGLHLYVPIVRNLRYDEVRALATTIAQAVLARTPKLATLEWATDRRVGKVFIDVNQNARIKSLACQYSPRAKPGAPVSIPLRWDELGKRYPDEFNLATALTRIEEVGDLWARLLESKVDLVETLGLPRDVR